MLPRNIDMPILAATVVAVVLGGLQAALAWHYLLDDALIHVRAAQLLLATGLPTTDGVTRSFSDSSPLFLFLTAAGLRITPSIYVPKVLSLVGYAIVVGLLAHRCRRAVPESERALALVHLLLVVSPFGVRWLTDGMETSCAVVAALVLAHGTAKRRIAWTVAVAALCVLVRVELAALVVAVAAGDLLRKRPRSAAASLVGAGIALVALQLFFGSIVPDASIAKARYLYSIPEFVVLLAGVAGGAGLFGVGLGVAWIAFVLAIATRLAKAAPIDREGGALLAGVASLPVALLIIFVRGQAVEGIRPLLPFIAFSSYCAVRLYLRLRADLSLHPRRWMLPVLPAVALVFVLDGMAFDRIVTFQARALAAMRDKDWSRLQGHTGLAWDVGYLSYFARTPVCDVQGLVEGPRYARLRQDERLERCAGIAEFAFVDQLHFAMLSGAKDLTDWRICDRFVFAKRSDTYVLYLLVEPRLAREPFCPSSAPRIGGAGDLDLSKLQSTAR